MSWEPKYDVGFIDEEFIVPIDCLRGYTSMNRSKSVIRSERLRYLYNKYNIKKEFEAIGFRGIIIEELIDIVYELKIFVVWGSPLIVDLRRGKSEFDRVDFISKENIYLNWDKEYELIEKFAEAIKIDFFRIDFLYDGKKLYASECAFMPSTILPEEIENFIEVRWQRPYYQHYYGMR